MRRGMGREDDETNKVLRSVSRLPQSSPQVNISTGATTWVETPSRVVELTTSVDNRILFLTVESGEVEQVTSRDPA